MKTNFIVTCIILLSVFSGFGQGNYLVVQKNASNKERIIKEGKRVKILSRQGNKIKGKLLIINNPDLETGPVLLIGVDTLKVGDISVLRTKSLFSKITGGVLTASGGFLAASGIALIAETASEGGYATFFGVVLGTLAIGSGVIVGTGGLLFLTIGKRYSSTRWNMKIMTTE